MNDFWSALFFVFMAEMGDKTQLMTLGFSASYKAWTVFFGVTLATMLINLISVALGESLGTVLPMFWINICAGIAFIAFGIWTLRGDDLEPGRERNLGKHGPLMTVAFAFFLAELGDKTMLTAVAVASRYHHFWQVWLGSTIGLVAANSLAILLGKTMTGRLSGKAMKFAVAAVFIISGIAALVDAFRHR